MCRNFLWHVDQLGLCPVAIGHGRLFRQRWCLTLDLDLEAILCLPASLPHVLIARVLRIDLVIEAPDGARLRHEHAVFDL